MSRKLRDRGTGAALPRRTAQEEPSDDPPYEEEEEETKAIQDTPERPRTGGADFTSLLREALEPLSLKITSDGLYKSKNPY